MSRVYIGPVDVWHRFKAGLSITHANCADDDSLWTVERTTQYDLERAAAVLGSPMENTPK